MALPVLIIGKSGSGKTTSLRNCVDDVNWGLISVLNKRLPFKGKIAGITTKDYQKVKGIIKSSKAKSIVIDDSGYLMTDYFMENHSAKKQGDSVYALYNTVGDDYYGLIKYVTDFVDDDNKIVYFFMHEDQDNFGNLKPKTIGKMLDEKVCIEGLFSIVLRAVKESGKHYFITQSDGNTVAKTPMGMFDDNQIDNDINIVDKTIREYYEMN